MNERIEGWSAIAKEYDPIKVGSIDATDTQPHDRGILRALNASYKNKESGDASKSIFIGRLNHDTTKELLSEMFAKFGKMAKMHLVRDIVTDHSKGYAFVEYEERQDANEAIRNMNHVMIDDRRVIVMWECARTLSNWVPRRLGGGFGGRKESGQLRFGGQEKPWRRPITIPLKLSSETFRGDGGKEFDDRSHSRTDQIRRDSRQDEEKERRDDKEYRNYESTRKKSRSRGRGGSRDEKKDSKNQNNSRSKDRQKIRTRDKKENRSRDKKEMRSRDKKEMRSREIKMSSRERKKDMSRDRKRCKSRDRKRSKSRDIKRIRSKDIRRSRSKDSKRSRSKNRKRSRSKDIKRSRSKDRSKYRKKSSSRDKNKKLKDEKLKMELKIEREEGGDEKTKYKNSKKVVRSQLSLSP